MACSACRRKDHNIQTCDRVRRCGQCNRHGHDRRNCPQLVEPLAAGSAAQWVTPDLIAKLCASREPLLAHLYWPENEKYFRDNKSAYGRGVGWSFTATAGHGVHQPSRPTINFFAIDRHFPERYELARKSRGLRHGVLVCRTHIERIASQPGYDLAKVEIGHPKGHGVESPEEFWRFDIGQHRYRAMAELCEATVVRLATPSHWRRRDVEIEGDGLVAWW
jgi:hypothetical protein